ncbi:MAG TPA: polysaccharide deacetylase family protein [Nitrosarchaeum sp.]|nr:polysaccharide deacetylase family protein [Nitrosarchaeum sp.]
MKYDLLIFSILVAFSFSTVYAEQTNNIAPVLLESPSSFHMNFLKQSTSGTQLIVEDNNINYLKLVTDGDNLPVFTRSTEINKSLLTSIFSANLFVDKPENVDELLLTFTSDNFSSGWYTYSIPPKTITNDWSNISFSINDLQLTGTQDPNSIDRMQIRIRDNGEPVSLGIRSIAFENSDIVNSLHENCNCVAFRLDDIQDYFLTDVQKTLIETFQKNDIDLTIGIIANHIGHDVNITDFISNLSKDPGIELANHGWEHEDFSQFDSVGQETLLLKSNDKISKMFGVTPTVFIPPDNAYNSGTIAALHSLGFTHFSSELDFETPPFPLSGQALYHFPETAFTGKLNKERTQFVGLDSNTTFDQVEKSINEHGFAVVTLHPQEFSLFYNQNYHNDVNYAQIEQLDLLFSKLKDHGIGTVLISEINNEPNQKLPVPHWIKNNAKWWIENKVSTEEFVNSLEFLISNKIIHVSQIEQTEKISNIPKWVKQNISWWVEGQTSDSEFLSATEFLIQNGIIEI